jgi:hypothetical protein
MMDRLPSWSGVSTSDGRGRFRTGSWGRFLDCSSEAGPPRVVVNLRSVPCATSPLVLAVGSVSVIQGREFVGRRATFLGDTALVVQVGTSHRVCDIIDVNVGGQCVQKLACLSFRAGSAKPESAQCSLEVVTTHVDVGRYSNAGMITNVPEPAIRPQTLSGEEVPANPVAARVLPVALIKFGVISTSSETRTTILDQADAIPDMLQSDRTS